METVTINYQTRKEYCDCCEQRLPREEVSNFKEFHFTRKSIKEWGDWKQVAQYEEDLEEVIEQYVYETIGFYAASSNERIIIDIGEFSKVKEFILENTVR